MFRILLAFTLLFYATNSSANNLWEDYDNLKDNLATQHGLDFGVDSTFTQQQTFSEGSLTRSFITPYFNLDLFDNAYGKGKFNFLMNVVRFNRETSTNLSNKLYVVNQINSYDVDYNELSDFYYSQTFSGKYDWLNFGVGQFSIAMFDNVIASDLQNHYFVNNALSQDGTFSYPSAGLGGYVSADVTSDVALTFGAIDATNPAANGIHIKDFNEDKMSVFSGISYTPKWNNTYQGAYSLLVYHKPSVTKAPEKSTGWSLYLAQDISEKTSLFFRANGASGDYTALDTSYSLGIIFNNPFNRAQNDQLAFAYGINKVNSGAFDDVVYHKYEKTLETYYDFRINSHIAIRPDLQIYQNPAFKKQDSYEGVASLSLYVGL